MKLKLADRQGFTLLEMMMTVAVLGIFFGVVYGFLNYNLRFMNQRSGEQDYQLQGRIVMFRVESLLRKYDKLTISGNVIRGDGINLINFDNTNTNPSLTGYQYFYCLNGSTGEIHGSSGNTVARGIVTFSFVDEGSVILVNVRSVPLNNPADPGQTLSTRLRKDRSYNPL